ncbi:MAG: hypothetical protein ABI650_00330 [Dokdonella sp.]
MPLLDEGVCMNESESPMAHDDVLKMPAVPALGMSLAQAYSDQVCARTMMSTPTTACGTRREMAGCAIRAGNGFRNGAFRHDRQMHHA